MLKTLLTPVAFILLLCSSAHAQSPSDSLPEIMKLNLLNQNAAELDTDHLILLGRGIENKVTRDLISIACVGDVANPCNLLQHVYLEHSSQTTYSFGPKINLDQLIHDGKVKPSASMDRKLKIAERNMAKNFRRYKSDHASTLAKVAKGGAYFVTTGGAAVAIVFLVSPIGSAAVGLSILGYAGFLGLSYVMTIGNNPLYGTQHSMIRAFKDQNGWNWSSNPKKISNRKFNLYLNAVSANAIQAVKVH